MSSYKTVFLDTCVWIELLAVSTPTQPHQMAQAALAGNLLKQFKEVGTSIITCEHQLLELINAILKAKKNEFNRTVKKYPDMKGVSSTKELRTKYPEEFKKGVALCKMAIDSIKVLTEKVDNADINIENILSNLEFVDINDYIYYEYCRKNDIKLYTFDLELEQMDNSNIVILLR